MSWTKETDWSEPENGQLAFENPKYTHDSRIKGLIWLFLAKFLYKYNFISWIGLYL